MKIKYIILLIFTLLFMSCKKHCEFISQKDFFEENKNTSFESWKNWHVILRPNTTYYIAYYDTNAMYYDYYKKEDIDKKNIKRFIFFKKESVDYIKLTIGDTLSKALLLKSFTNDSLWINNYNIIDSNEVIRNCGFVLKYNFGLKEVKYMKNPERLHFKSDSIDLMYLYMYSDSGCCGYNNKLAPNWYSSNVSH